MKVKKRGSIGTVLIVGLLGGLLGVATGLLMAPQSGQQTQQMVKSAYTNMVTGTGERLLAVEEDVSASVSRVSSRIQGVPGQIKSGIQGLSADIDTVVSARLTEGTTYLVDTKERVVSMFHEGSDRLNLTKAQ